MLTITSTILYCINKKVKILIENRLINLKILTTILFDSQLREGLIQAQKYTQTIS